MELICPTCGDTSVPDPDGIQRTLCAHGEGSNFHFVVLRPHSVAGDATSSSEARESWEAYMAQGQ